MRFACVACFWLFWQLLFDLAFCVVYCVCLLCCIWRGLAWFVFVLLLFAPLVIIGLLVMCFILIGLFGLGCLLWWCCLVGLFRLLVLCCLFRFFYMSSV